MADKYLITIIIAGTVLKWNELPDVIRSAIETLSV